MYSRTLSRISEGDAGSAETRDRDALGDAPVLGVMRSPTTVAGADEHDHEGMGPAKRRMGEG